MRTNRPLLPQRSAKPVKPSTNETMVEPVAKPFSWYARMAKWSARAAARPMAFALAVGIILAWMVTGPLFNFSDTWQLVINTATTVVTFLMVFLIQSTQNRDTMAIQV